MSLPTGKMQKLTRIKEGATPIDDITKFAWADEDYETVEVWYEYTADELARIEAAESAAREKEALQTMPQRVDDIESAVMELGDVVGENELTMEDIMNAVLELGDILTAAIDEG